MPSKIVVAARKFRLPNCVYTYWRGTARHTHMRETILILEDMPELSDLMALVLQRNGFNVTVAATIEEARRAWSQLNGADMLISDAHVPDGSGLRLAAELKREKPGLHVIISTGNLSDPLPRAGSERAIRSRCLQSALER